MSYIKAIHDVVLGRKGDVLLHFFESVPSKEGRENLINLFALTLLEREKSKDGSFIQQCVNNLLSTPYSNIEQVKCGLFFIDKIIDTLKAVRYKYLQCI